RPARRRGSIAAQERRKSRPTPTDGQEKGTLQMADAKAERLKAIEGALTQIERQFGKGSIMRLGQRETLALEIIPTGSLAVDSALGVGGFPRRRRIDIFRPGASGP